MSRSEKGAPCRCGSGLPYERCCMAKDAAADAAHGRAGRPARRPHDAEPEAQVARLSANAAPREPERSGARRGDSARKRTDARRKQAEALLREAMHAPHGGKRAQLAMRALILYPDSPDAYLVLAEESRTESQMLDYLRKGVEAGERELGPDYFREHAGRFWLLLETRPFMRVKAAYADALWMAGRAEDAAAQAEQMLALNRSDNTGARYMLMSLYVELDRFDDADRLLQRYSDDASAFFAYDRMLLEYKRSGLTAALRLLYRSALNLNRHIPAYLLGRKPLPKHLNDYYTVGDASEAAHYAIDRIDMWRRHPELLHWMKEQ